MLGREGKKKKEWEKRGTGNSRRFKGQILLIKSLVMAQGAVWD